jgi:hypothetical protein
MLVGSSLAAPATASSAASVASGDEPPRVREESASARPCADERDWVEAERGTPSVLLTMAQEALVKCESNVTTQR